MKTDDLIKHIEEGKLLPRVSYYCNGYCEYCKFVDTCLNFFMQKEDFGRVGSRNSGSIHLWEKLEKHKDEIIDQVYNFGEVIGFDFKVHPERNIRKHVERAAKLNMISIFSALDNRDEYIVPQKPTFKEKITETFKRTYNIKLSKENLDEIVTVSYWLNTHYFYKLSRAFDSKEKNDMDDANKIAKTTLFMLEKLLYAMGNFALYYKKNANSIMPALVELYWVYIVVKEVFPNAMDSVRDGLDS